MRVAWLLDGERTPAVLMPQLIAHSRALAQRGHDVVVFGLGDRPRWLPWEICFSSVKSLRVAPETVSQCDAVIGTHWSHAGALLDAGTAAPFLLLGPAGPEEADALASTVQSLPVHVLATSQHVVRWLGETRPRGEVWFCSPPGNGAGPGQGRGAARLEDVLARAVEAHRARIPDRVTLGLAMIVRDEQESLRRCLASAAPVVDQMVVVDTGSRDGTVSVAREAGALVVSYEWQDDFAAARNVALDHVETDWVLVLDADEQVARTSGPVIRRAITNPLVDGFLLDILNFAGEVTISGGVTHANVRLFRRLPGVRYEGALHEQVGPSLLRAGGCVRPLPGAVILHYGYLGAAVEGYDKKRRNLEIAKRQAREDPHDPFVHFNLAVEYMRQRDRSRAIKHFQRAFRLLPGPHAPYAPALLRHLAACLMDEGRYDEALVLLEHAKAVYPGYVDLRYLRGLALNRMGRYKDALQELNECLRMGDSGSMYTFSQLGVGSFLAQAAAAESHFGLGEVDEAIAARQALAEEVTRRLGEVVHVPAAAVSAVTSVWVRAEEDLRAGRLQDALAGYRCLLGPDTRDVFLTTQLGQLWPRKIALELAVGDSATARQDLGQLAGVNPRAARAVRMLLERCLSACEAAASPSGRVAEAGGNGARVGERADGGAGQLGWRDVAPFLAALIDVGREDWFNRACDVLRGGLMDPGELDRELGKLYFHRGLKDKAVVHLMASVERGGADPAVLHALGEISSAAGLHTEARTFFREAIRRQPGDARWWVSLALCYHRAGRDRAGLRVLELARRHAGGEAIHAARMGLGISLQLSRCVGPARRPPCEVTGEVDS